MNVYLIQMYSWNCSKTPQILWSKLYKDNNLNETAGFTVWKRAPVGLVEGSKLWSNSEFMDYQLITSTEQYQSLQRGLQSLDCSGDWPHLPEFDRSFPSYNTYSLSRVSWATPSPQIHTIYFGLAANSHVSWCSHLLTFAGTLCRQLSCSMYALWCSSLFIFLDQNNLAYGITVTP